MSNNNPLAPVNRPLLILTLLATAVAVYGFFQPEPSSEGKRFYLENTGGAVLFTHAAHQEQDNKCVACHHELIQGQAYDCSECHDEPEYVIGANSHDELVEVEDHSCVDCHLVQPNTAARSCRDCHPSVAEKSTDVADLGDCLECHDEPEYAASKFTHAELLEVEDHSCSDCHQINPVVEAYHNSCSACHREQAKDRFIDDQDQAICKTCHLI